jgi:uncharacterized membrane protein
MNFKTVISATFAALTCVAMPAFATDTTANDMPACKGMKDCNDGKLCKGAENQCKGGNKCTCHGTSDHKGHSTSENEAVEPSQEAS